VKILGTTFKNVVQEDGKKKAFIEGPLVPAMLLSPFAAFGVLGFALGRLTKR
jgi:hypothetical protein